MVLETPDPPSNQEAMLLPESYCQAVQFHFMVTLILPRSLSLSQRYLKWL